MLKFAKYKFGYGGNAAHNDEWAHYLFPDGGFFVEVGASRGVWSSSCYELEKLGWNGICVEPNSLFFNMLILNRDVPCENCCLTDKNGETIFIECHWLGKTIDSFLQSKWWRKELMDKGISTIKKTMTLESLLIKHNAPKTIEFLAMDIEGSEFSVLENFPFDKYRILTIALEGDSCTKLLKRNGYSEVINPWSMLSYEHHYTLNKFLF